MSFPEININVVNNNRLTIFDLLLQNNEIKRCKYAIKLLIKHRYPDISINDCLELTLFSLRQSSKHQQFNNEIFNYFSNKSCSSLKKESKNADTKDRESSSDGNENPFIRKFLNRKQLALCSFTKSSYMSSPNSSNSSIKLPNYEETDITFETSEVLSKRKTYRENKHKIFQESKTKLSQKPIAKFAKVKPYISSNEAIKYCNFIARKKDKMPYFCTQTTCESNYSEYSEECNGRYSKEKVVTDSLLNKSVSVTKCAVELSVYRKLSQGSYGIGIYDVLCRQPYVSKAVITFAVVKCNKIFMKDLNILNVPKHSNMLPFLGVHSHTCTPLIVMEKMWWLNLPNWLEIDPSSSLDSFHKEMPVLDYFVNGINNLQSKNVILHSLTAESIHQYLNTIKISDSEAADKTVIHLLGNIFNIHPETCKPNPVHVENFHCAVISTIIHKLPNRDNVSFITLAFLQDGSLCIDLALNFYIIY